jgi:hypothetical protein
MKEGNVIEEWELVEYEAIRKSFPGAPTTRMILCLVAEVRRQRALLEDDEIKCEPVPPIVAQIEAAVPLATSQARITLHWDRKIRELASEILGLSYSWELYRDKCPDVPVSIERRMCDEFIRQLRHLRDAIADT